jgi:hypothetical protein
LEIKISGSLKHHEPRSYYKQQNKTTNTNDKLEHEKKFKKKGKVIKGMLGIPRLESQL